METVVGGRDLGPAVHARRQALPACQAAGMPRRALLQTTCAADRESTPHAAHRPRARQDSSCESHRSAWAVDQWTSRAVDQ